jgi:hypothetical protein
MSIRKIPVAWQTGVGGSGVSVFYSPFGTDLTADLGTFFNAIKALFPGSVTWDIPSSGDVIQESDGIITGAWTAGTPASIVATGAGNYVGGTGAFVKWQTAGVVGGRRVKGRTFMCPLLATCFDSTGTIASTSLTTLSVAAAALSGSGKMVIWHRPTTKAAANGSQHAVVGSSVPDKVTSLRTRRT